jgi:hypothetical protein
MAQLTDTLIIGDLRVTGNIYGTDVGNRVSATYRVEAQTGGRWAKLASAAVATGTYCNVNGDWIVRAVGETFSLDMPFTLNVRTYANNDAPGTNAFIKLNTESSYRYKTGTFGVCVVTYGNTPNVTVEVWVHTGYNYSSISLIELASGGRDISPRSQWTYTNVSGAGSSKPTASGTTRVTDATTVLLGCCADNTYGAGNSTTPVYVSNLGVLTSCSAYAGGTAVSVNQTSYSGTTANIFAPTSVAGSSGARSNYLVISNDAGNATWKLNTNVEVGTATYPTGFANRNTGANWGTHPNGTLVTDWADGSGGDIAFWKNCPSNGQLSALVDGYYYQREGLYRCVDTSEVNLNGAAVIEYSSSTDTVDIKFK